MSNTRTESELAAMFKALSNPHRLAVFMRLSRCCAPGTLCDIGHAPCLSVGQLGDGLDIAPSTLSHHIKTLSQAGLLHTQRRGKQVLCWIEPATLRQLSAFFSQPLTPALSTGSTTPEGSSRGPQLQDAHDV